MASEKVVRDQAAIMKHLLKQQKDQKEWLECACGCSPLRLARAYFRVIDGKATVLGDCVNCAQTYEIPVQVIGPPEELPF